MKSPRFAPTLLLVTIGLLSGCATADESSETPASSAQSSGGDSTDGVERFLVRFSPDEWKVATHNENGQQMMTELVPPDEEVESWSRLITLQVTRNTPVTATQFFERIGAGFTQACGSTRLTMLPQQSQAGYDVHIALVFCGLNPATGRGEVVHLKVVRGRDALYVAQYAQRVDPFNAEQESGLSAEGVRELITTLAPTLVCMEGGTQPSCPTGIPPAD